MPEYLLDRVRSARADWYRTARIAVSRKDRLSDCVAKTVRKCIDSSLQLSHHHLEDRRIDLVDKREPSGLSFSCRETEPFAIKQVFAQSNC
jgi:hypothetical protein